jgi:hypothetical protein
VAGIDHSGSTLILWAKSHDTTGPAGARTIATEYAYIPNAWHVTEADILAEGGPGAFLPTGGGGGGSDVDYDQVELRIRKVMGVEEVVGGETVQHRFSPLGGGNFRQGILDKAGDAITNKGVITTGNVANAIYHPTLDAIWLNLEKLVQGTDNPTSMNAQQLHDGFVALIHNAKGGQ